MLFKKKVISFYALVRQGNSSQTFSVLFPTVEIFQHMCRNDPSPSQNQKCSKAELRWETIFKGTEREREKKCLANSGKDVQKINFLNSKY